jgi:hypothetical protein
MTTPASPSHHGMLVACIRATPVKRAPGAGEQVAQVLADRDPEIAVERLEHDVDGLATRRAGVGVSASARAR